MSIYIYVYVAWLPDKCTTAYICRVPCLPRIAPVLRQLLWRTLRSHLRAQEPAALLTAFGQYWALESGCCTDVLLYNT